MESAMTEQKREIQVKVLGDSVGWWVVTEGGATDQKLGPYTDQYDALTMAAKLRTRIKAAQER